MKRLNLTILLLLLQVPMVSAESQLLDRVVAVVNNEAITQSELDFLLRPVYEQYRQEYKGNMLFEKLTQARLKLLNQLIEDKLVFQVAKEQNIQVDEAELDKQWEAFKANFKSDAEMEKALTEQAMNETMLKERFRKQAMVQELQNAEIRAKIIVSPLEVEGYYQDHPEDFVEKDRIKIRSITIKKSEEAREKGLKDEESWRVVHDIRAKLVKGEAFAVLAEEFSEDVHAANGGLGGWIQRGDMAPAIDEVIFKMNPGEISEVMETAMGYHIFQVEEVREGSKLSLEEARDQIFSYLYKIKMDERFREWMNELKKKAYISIR